MRSNRTSGFVCDPHTSIAARGVVFRAEGNVVLAVKQEPVGGVDDGLL